MKPQPVLICEYLQTVVKKYDLGGRGSKRCLYSRIFSTEHHVASPDPVKGQEVIKLVKLVVRVDSNVLSRC